MLMQIPGDIDEMNADQIADAFLFSEQVYVHEGLRVLADHFEKRLRIHNELKRPVLERKEYADSARLTTKLCDQILSQNEIDNVFLNISNIYVVNSRLYKELLLSRMANDLTNTCGRIMSRMIPFFKLYAQYITGQRRASQQLSALRARKNKVNEFLEISERCSGYNVSDLMEMPIFRLPQYLVFLGALFKRLDPASEASNDVKQAIVAIQEVTDHISNNLKDDAQRRLVVKFQEKMFKGSVALVAPSRLVLKYGPLTKIFNKKASFVKAKKYMFVLFNDAFLYASLQTAVHSSKVKHVLQLTGMNIKDVPEHEKNPVKFAFVVRSNTKSFVVCCDNATEKREWIQAITEAIKNNDEIQSELSGFVPANGEEFEKMIMKKKYNTRKVRHLTASLQCS
jgi:signal recognition particle subunit SEC65/ribosomal protein S15P/S13E